jgi:hypothetical protein
MKPTRLAPLIAPLIAPLFALAALAFAAPAALAQAPTQPADPAPPPAASMPAAPDGTPACRTSREPGEACACLSDTSNIGEAARTRDDGPVMCVVPAPTGASQGDAQEAETSDAGQDSQSGAEAQE